MRFRPEALLAITSCCSNQTSKEVERDRRWELVQYERGQCTAVLFVIYT